MCNRLKNLIFLPVLAIAVVLTAGCPREQSASKPLFQRVLPPSPDSSQTGEEAVVPEQDLIAMQSSVQADPENLFLRFDLLVALDHAGRYNEALDQARAIGAVQTDNPLLSVAYLNFATIVLDKIPADDPDRPALLTEAIEGMNKALQDDPGSVPGQIAMGRLALETGDNDSALHHLSIALAATEIGYKLRMKMAQIYIEKQDYAKARAHLDAAKVLAQEANDRAAVRQIGRLMGQLR